MENFVKFYIYVCCWVLCFIITMCLLFSQYGYYKYSLLGMNVFSFLIIIENYKLNKNI